MTSQHRHFVSLGMFIIDEFLYLDDVRNHKGRTLQEQIGGGGTYANIGARIWLPGSEIGMIVDRGHDFPMDIQERLDSYGEDMWFYRDDKSRGTTRARNTYQGDFRGFEYLTPRVRITPKDLDNTKLARPSILHFICSPTRAGEIMSEVLDTPGWKPTSIYEPIPDRCVPGELPALVKVLPTIDVLSPNAEEALSLLSIASPVTKALVEQAASRFLELGVGPNGDGAVIIRSGSLGAYITTRKLGGKWVDAFWNSDNIEQVVDVTGAGNGFLGGLAAGLYFTKDIYEAIYYATVSASFIIQQEGLPKLSNTVDQDGHQVELWNHDSPERRLDVVKSANTLLESKVNKS
ncbi:hypothetical protein ABKN59_000240 [Abortiporus biennis]